VFTSAQTFWVFRAVGPCPAPLCEKIAMGLDLRHYMWIMVEMGRVEKKMR